MSQHSKPIRFNHSTLSVCTVVMAIMIMATTAACTKNPESASMDHSKMGGMEHVDGMSMTGDTDYDFAANMRTHHQAAVDMSQDELKNGKDPQMLQMAKDIIAAQKKEIAELDRWLETHKP